MTQRRSGLSGVLSSDGRKADSSTTPPSIRGCFPSGKSSVSRAEFAAGTSHGMSIWSSVECVCDVPIEFESAGADHFEAEAAGDVIVLAPHSDSRRLLRRVLPMWVAQN